jgi:undecaprenyl-diphosphatase
MDAILTRLINAPAGHGGLLDLLMIGLADYSVPLLVLAIVLQWWRRRERDEARQGCVLAGLSFLLALGFNQLILLFVHRLRPYDAGVSHLIVGPNPDWSFPSDHPAACFAIAGAYLGRPPRWQGTVLLILAVLIAYARIYVGVHYLGDVLGGALTGLLAARAIQAFYPSGSRLDRFVIRIV